MESASAEVATLVHTVNTKVSGCSQVVNIFDSSIVIPNGMVLLCVPSADCNHRRSILRELQDLDKDEAASARVSRPHCRRLQWIA